MRPLPGTMPDGIVISPDGTAAYVDERVSADVAVLSLDRSSGALVVAVAGAPISRVAAHDPMPANLRLGQQLFNLGWWTARAIRSRPTTGSPARPATWRAAATP